MFFDLLAIAARYTAAETPTSASYSDEDLKKEHPMRPMRLNRSARVVVGALTLAVIGPAFAGEINQLVCDLRGDQEVPPNPSPGFGCGRFVIDTNANTLDYHIVFDGVVSGETAAHIHGAANPGFNAGVQHPLPTGTTKTGTWNYPESMEADILNGRTYVNIHSNAFPGGELRGQISKLVARIDGIQVPTPCLALGWGVFSIDVCNNTLDYHISVSGLLSCGTETAAHIHGSATHGANAGIQHPLPAGNPKVGTWNYPESLESDILQGLMYVNIHTTASPGGAIRGQITQIVVPVDESQVAPVPTGSSFVGCGYISVDKDNNRLGYDVRRSPLLVATAAHFHGFAAPGANAGVLHTIGVLNPALGIWSYTAAQEPSILDSKTYINIHSGIFPAGEIRGQVYIPPKKGCIVDCPWDCANNDGAVNVRDLLALLGQWDTSNPPCDGGGSCDFDGDGCVGITDLLKLLAHYDPAGVGCP